MAQAFWLIKSEPFKYSWAQFVRDGKTVWDGVRNFEARKSLRAMKTGDLAFFYHSNEGKEIVGIARVKREAYPDPTTDEDWSAVDFEPVVPLSQRVSLDEIHNHPELQQMVLLKRSRLSVIPVTPDEFKIILQVSKTEVPKRALAS